MAFDSEPENRFGGFALKLVRGLAETVVVLAAAAAAGYGLLYFLRQQHLDLASTAPWFAAVISSISFVAFYVLNRGRADAEGMREINARLAGRPKTKSDVHQHRLNLSLEAKGLKDESKGFAKSHDEFMLICRQAKGEKKYTTDHIREQIVFLKDSGPHPNTKWVVFTTNEGEFIAFQEFDKFMSLVLNEQAGLYREGLNLKEADEAKAWFLGMVQKEANRLNESGPPEDSVIIFGLNQHCIKQGKTRKEIIAFMKERRIEEAMVVGAGNKPVGIVRLSELVSSVFGDML